MTQRLTRVYPLQTDGWMDRQRHTTTRIIDANSYAVARQKPNEKKTV